jgi:hypothetical protein
MILFGDLLTEVLEFFHDGRDGLIYEVGEEGIFLAAVH